MYWRDSKADLRFQKKKKKSVGLKLISRNDQILRMEKNDEEK